MSETHPTTAPQIAVNCKLTPPLTSGPAVITRGPTVVQSGGKPAPSRMTSVAETPPPLSSENSVTSTTPPFASLPFQSNDTVSCCPGTSVPAPRLAALRVGLPAAVILSLTAKAPAELSFVVVIVPPFGD